MNDTEQSLGPIPLRWLPLLGIPAAALGIGICVGIAVNEPEDLAAAQFGYELFLQAIGAMTIGVGLIGLVIEVLLTRRTRVILGQALVLASGLAVSVRDGWSVIGLALALAAIVLHEYLSAKSREEGDPAGR